MDDAQAIRRLKSGDIGGLEALVDRYQVKAVRAAFLITNDEALAEDVVQDTFIRVYRRIQSDAHSFDETRPFELYLMRSVMNASLTAIRSRSRASSFDDSLDGLESLLARAASVETQVEQHQLRGEILAALAGLSPKQRAVVVQRYYLGMSEKEMAQALDVPPGTVKWLLNAARTRLRELLHPGRSAK